MICEKLADGKITALDRSGVAIDAATQANVEHVRSGKAAFHHNVISPRRRVGSPAPAREAGQGARRWMHLTKCTA